MPCLMPATYWAGPGDRVTADPRHGIFDRDALQRRGHGADVRPAWRGRRAVAYVLPRRNGEPDRVSNSNQRVMRSSAPARVRRSRRRGCHKGLRAHGIAVAIRSAQRKNALPPGPKLGEAGVKRDRRQTRLRRHGRGSQCVLRGGGGATEKQMSNKKTARMIDRRYRSFVTGRCKRLTSPLFPSVTDGCEGDGNNNRYRARGVASERYAEQQEDSEEKRRGSARSGPTGREEAGRGRSLRREARLRGGPGAVSAELRGHGSPGQGSRRSTSFWGMS